MISFSLTTKFPRAWLVVGTGYQQWSAKYCYYVYVPLTYLQEDNQDQDQNQNDVIEFHNNSDRRIVWYEFGPGGKINKIHVFGLHLWGRVLGAWGRMPEVSVAF